SDWSLGISLQQQIGPQSSVDVTYSRRWYRGFSVVDNRALEPSDLTPFSLLAPVAPRLPRAGGYVFSGLYDVVPDKSGQIDNLVADSSRYGSWSQYFNGIDATVNVRIGRRFMVVRGGPAPANPGATSSPPPLPSRSSPPRRQGRARSVLA